MESDLIQSKIVLMMKCNVLANFSGFLVCFHMQCIMLIYHYCYFGYIHGSYSLASCRNLMAKQDLAELGFKSSNGGTPGGKIAESIDN